MAEKLTTGQYRQAMKQARSRHDIDYEIDNPKPVRGQEGEKTGVERAISYLWIVWAILGIAGAVISLPHTLNTVLGTVDLARGVAVLYSLAVFIGVELALISVALVSALKTEEQRRGPGKQASLAGLINLSAARIGLRPVFNLSHLPDKRAGGGAFVVGLLFAASLTFNMADALQDVPMLATYGPEIHLASRLMAGALGPGLLLIAGHRFAHEFVQAITSRQRLDRAYEQSLAEWEAGREASWREGKARYIGVLLNEKLGADAWDISDIPTLEGEPAAYPFGSNGNGHHNGNGHARG